MRRTRSHFSTKVFKKYNMNMIKSRKIATTLQIAYFTVTLSLNSVLNENVLLNNGKCKKLLSIVFIQFPLFNEIIIIL